MDVGSQRPKGREEAISALNAAMEALNLAKNISGITPAKVIFGSVSALLTTIRDSTVNELDCARLGLSCADVCRTLHRGVSGKKPDELSRSVYDAISLLTSTVADIQGKLLKWSKRSMVSRRFHAKNDKERIAAWRLDLDKILHIFTKELATSVNAAVSGVHHDVANTHTIASGVENGVVKTHTIVSAIQCNASKSPKDTRGQEQMTHASAPGESPPLPPGSTHGIVSDISNDVVKSRASVSKLERNVTNTHTMISDIHRTMMKGQEGSSGKNPPTQTSMLGESPPLPPKTFFGRDELVEKIVGLAENFIPIALIGAGGVGKTFIALAILHHDRIKHRFGDDRRFIRCDQFPASCAHFLRRLSNVVGAGTENPGDLTPLRTFLSSKEMLIVLDNAESILDPQGTDTGEIYDVVEELSRFSNICICITSRISTIPPDYNHLDIPTLSRDAAHDTFYRIYDSDDRSEIVSGILEQLDFHPLSITLLATVARQNKWDTNRLAREWKRRRTSVLQTRHNKSLAAAIELSLTSPMFRELGPDARELLGVVAFFPQGVDESNLDRLFSTISNRTDVFDGFCVLSLTHRNNGFITMLAPLRDYLSPKDPKSSPLLCAIKDHYFTRLSVNIGPDKPGFGETRWITSEDMNVEHLLDVFTTIDGNSNGVWDACANFMTHLYWHKARLVILKPKIEGLPDRHWFKPVCLLWLSRLFGSVGNQAERTWLLAHSFKLGRGWGSDHWVALILEELSDSSRLLGHTKEGIQMAREALKILERVGNTVQRAECLIDLAHLLYDDKQLDAAEEVVSRVIDLVPEKGDRFLVCRSHLLLGDIYRSKGETEKAIRHFELDLGIATPFNWHRHLFWVHHALVELFLDEGRFDDAQAHVERAKSHAVNSAYNLGRAVEQQAMVWYKQHRFEEAGSEYLRATDLFEKLGATRDMGRCRRRLWAIKETLNSPVASGQSGFDSQETKR